MRTLSALLFLFLSCDPGESPPYVEIRVDSLGVPHIYGVDDEAAFFGAGYMQARDRLYQMDMARRRAYGRQAEVLGLERLEDDKVARAFRWAIHGREDADAVRATQPATWAVLEAWVAGVNLRIDEVLAGEAPLEEGFEEYGYEPTPWSPEDVMVIAKMTGFGNDLSLEYEVFATIASKVVPAAYEAVEVVRPIRDTFSVPESVRPTELGACWPRDGLSSEPVPGLEALAGLRERFAPLRVMGSNNWAVDGRHTDTGRPLIAGDPHQGFDFPGLFYALHVNSRRQGGRFDVAGFSFVGVPGVSMGQTDRVAWAVTTSFADVMDIWSVEVGEDGVRLGGEVLPIVERVEEIRVRSPGEPVGAGRLMSFRYQDVPGGGLVLPRDLVPIPIAGPGRELLFDWTGFRPRDGGGLLDLNAARSVDEFVRAVEGTGSLNFNFVVADANGIGYRVGVEVPRREVTERRRPWLVLDGDDPGSRWDQGWLDPEQTPRGDGGARGFLVTANNDPFGFTADGRLDDDPWYYGALFAPGWRAAHIDQTLSELVARGAVTLEDMRALQLDAHSGLADDLLPLLDEVTDPSLAPLVDQLRGWDRQMRRDSPEALVFHAFAHLLTEEAIGDDLSLLYLEAMSLQPVFILKLAAAALSGRSPRGAELLQEGRGAIVEAALRRTRAWLEQRFAEEPYRYSDMRVTSFRDSFGAGLDFGEIPSDGGESTVNVAPSRFYAPGSGEVADRWVSRYGPVFRVLGTFKPSGVPELHIGRPIGNRPARVEPGDDWVEGRDRRLPFTREEVEADTVEHLELTADGEVHVRG